MGIKISKKAIAMTTIIGFIILILGFAILILFYTQMSWTGTVDREVCHQSVIYRGTLPALGGLKEYVPLKCKTGKICVTSSSSGKCSEFENTAGVTRVRVKDIDDVEKTIAQEILTCWETMGEGKISMFSDWMVQNYGFGTLASSCVVCSRIAFDKENLAKSGINLSKMDIHSYMINHKIPDKDYSYFVYLTGSGGKMSIDEKIKNSVMIEEPSSDSQQANQKTRVDLEENTNNQELLGKELSVMFMQVQAPPTYGDVFMNDVTTIIGAGGAGYMLGGRFATGAMGTVLKSPWTWAILAVAGIYQASSVYQNQAVAAGKCGDISAGDGTRKGCSVVRTTGYNVDDLKNYCSIIESIA